MFKPHLVLLSLLNLVFCGVSVSLFPLTVLPLTSLKLLIVVVGRRTNEQKTHKKICYGQVYNLVPSKNSSSFFWMEEVQCRRIIAWGLRTTLLPEVAWVSHWPRGRKTQATNDRRMGKLNVIYEYMLFSRKKWLPFDTCYTTDGLWKLYAKGNKPDTKGQILLYDSTHMRHLEWVNS